METPDSITLETLQERKKRGQKFSVLTCYDAPMARLMASAGVDVLLVGDTAAEVLLGLSSTRDISPEFLLTITAAVRRGAPRAFVMADLPHACRREGDPTFTANWIRRFFEETGCNAVKVEVTGQDAGLVEAACGGGVPVVAHLGLLPQRIDEAKGYRAWAKEAGEARQLITDARRMADAGASMLLLEAVASEAARAITQGTRLPVIGCVSGAHCDGTVVVLHDMLGLGAGHPPRHVKRYENLSDILERAFARYADDVRSGRFPTDKDAPHMRAGEAEKLAALTGEV